ncbi:GNAT family N-acetyltransferase [Bacillus sp. N1-1]|jgi:putative acetyltransferase|uniref:GNAT family N-acetyltransferase n=1 Tax=Bacillus sp. N1-1 TaxID=2682541 RepID=UPI001316D895|nr:GNAT family N-acetyltransferase [Bacillus sp. N1-1]QHA92085.1 GNAT family N-acetyltransferase [Bacillus sp. N1-1]
MKIRQYEPKDLDQIIELFQQTVYIINRQDYSANQVNAWVNSTTKSIRYSKWAQEFEQNFTYIAEEEGEVVGFIDLTAAGYLDRLYVHRYFQRAGIASLLLSEIESTARSQQLNKITTEASITARPFFEAQHFQTIKKQTVEISDVKMTNFLMEKKLKRF